MDRVLSSDEYNGCIAAVVDELTRTNPQLVTNLETLSGKTLTEIVTEQFPYKEEPVAY